MLLVVSTTLLFLVSRHFSCAGCERRECREPKPVCSSLLEKVACSYDDNKDNHFLRETVCYRFHPSLGEQVNATNCTYAAEEYTLAECTFLQVRHYAHIDDPPAPYIQGVKVTEQAQENKQLFKTGAQVLTDIDDTIKCSGGHQPAGIDSTCKHTSVGALYPGVVAFYKALALGHQGASTKVSRHRFPIPLSARPRALSWVLGMKRCRKVDLFFRQLACEGDCTFHKCHKNYRWFRESKHNICDCFGLNTEDAQYGELWDYGPDRANEHMYKTFEQKEITDQKPVFESGGYSKMAFSKFNGFLNLFKTSKGSPMVFVGDNGQGDFSAAQMMLRFKDTHGHHHMHAAFIHYVRKDMDPDSAQFTAAQKAWGKQRIYVFRDYMEAARIALEKHIISKDQFEVVKESYMEDLKRVSSMVAHDDDDEDDHRSEMDDKDDVHGSPEERVSQQEAKDAKKEYTFFLQSVRNDDWSACSSGLQSPNYVSSGSPLTRKTSQESRSRSKSKDRDHKGDHHGATHSEVSTGQASGALPQRTPSSSDHSSSTSGAAIGPSTARTASHTQHRRSMQAPIGTTLQPIPESPSAPRQVMVRPVLKQAAPAKGQPLPGPAVASRQPQVMVRPVPTQAQHVLKPPQPAVLTPQGRVTYSSSPGHAAAAGPARPAQPAYIVPSKPQPPNQVRTVVVPRGARYVMPQPGAQPVLVKQS
eukprot:TRINITY_DN14025_c0_g1_i1.p1 TRINITY_DN14025_c0_g1~~TRINITY_DN14025_c0_g1_i1.p1  ORF type:complete len:700 (+),score=44.24 TRINITY_DN14025_c0_g1_i1:163-2262(+)